MAIVNPNKSSNTLKSIINVNKMFIKIVEYSITNLANFATGSLYFHIFMLHNVINVLKSATKP